jgi:hypothetical protein
MLSWLVRAAEEELSAQIVRPILRLTTSTDDSCFFRLRAQSVDPDVDTTARLPPRRRHTTRIELATPASHFGPKGLALYSGYGPQPTSCTALSWSIMLACERYGP